MKKVLSAMLALMLCASMLAGCGDNNSSASEGTDSTSSGTSSAAQESSQTCCASYEERRPGAGQNAMGQNPSVETEIHCKVKGCAYNSHNRCDAQNVCVACCCGDVSSKSGTQCSTFQCK